MNHFDQIHQYHENLLRSQYEVSEIIADELSRGVMREEFLKEMLLKRRTALKITKGIVSNGTTQSEPCDLIFYDSRVAVNVIAESAFIEPKNCKLVLEIKSNADGENLKLTNENFEIIKNINTDNKPLCGLFCYNTKLKKETILNRFGYSYDKELESWIENQTSKIHYPNIDFIICIACLEIDEECIEKQFFLIKDEESGRFILKSEYPIIKNFFGITDNL